MASRSRRFRNSDGLHGDAARRALWRQGRAGDPQAALRYGAELRRTGQLDERVVSAMANLSEERGNDLLASWAVADGDGRIRLYRALATAGVRYPEPAFLSALSRQERVLCCAAACMASGAPRWTSRIERFGLHQSPHSIEVVYPESRGFTHKPDRPGNQSEFEGAEGLERARERVESMRIENGWAELVRATIRHLSGGFVEHVLFLTPTGYALRAIYFHGEDLHEGRRWSPGVSHWNYDAREGFLPDAVDPLSVRHDLPFISAVHALEIAVQGLLDASAPQSLSSRHNHEHVPGVLVADVGQNWRATSPRVLFHEDQACGEYDRPAARCMVVIPPATGVPSVTIGISGSATGLTTRTRNVTPAHFWTELGPWRESRNLVRRLATWAAEDRPDRVRVEDGNVALVWAAWAQEMRRMIDDLPRGPGPAQVIDRQRAEEAREREDADAREECPRCHRVAELWQADDGGWLCGYCRTEAE